MRPDVLNLLFAEVEALKGVGPANAKALARLGLTRAVDLAYHFRQFFGGVNSAFDFDNDGTVSASDFIQFRLRFGGSI